MTQSHAESLASVQTLIAEIQSAAANGVEEYELNGRRVRRSDYARLLQTLYARETVLLKRVAYSSRSPVRLGKIGRPGPTSR